MKLCLFENRLFRSFQKTTAYKKNYFIAMRDVTWGTFAKRDHFSEVYLSREQGLQIDIIVVSQCR